MTQEAWRPSEQPAPTKEALTLRAKRVEHILTNNGTVKTELVIALLADMRQFIESAGADSERYRWLMAQQWFWEDGRDMAPYGRYWISIHVVTRKGRPSLPEVIDAALAASSPHKDQP